MKPNILATVALGFWVVSCATVETKVDKAKPAATQMLFAYQSETPTATATLILTRDSGTPSAICPVSIHIDGVLAGQFASGETASFHVEPGEHVLKMGWSKLAKGPCALARNLGVTRELVIAANASKSYRLAIGISGVMDIQRSGQ